MSDHRNVPISWSPTRTPWHWHTRVYQRTSWKQPRFRKIGITERQGEFFNAFFSNTWVRSAHLCTKLAYWRSVDDISTRWLVSDVNDFILKFRLLRCHFELINYPSIHQKSVQKTQTLQKFFQLFVFSFPAYARIHVECQWSQDLFFFLAAWILSTSAYQKYQIFMIIGMWKFYR